MPNSKQKINLKIVKGPTNYFHLALFILASLAVGFFIYLSIFLTTLYQEELQLTLAPQLFSKGTILILTAPETEYQVGDLIKVKISLEMKQRKTQGVDIILKYDPEVLALLTVEGQKEDFSKTTLAVKVDPLNYLNTQESVFDIFPYLIISEKEGLISFSALAKPLQKISGKVVVGSLNFQALKKGETSLSIVFEKGETTESNVAFLGTDILENVKNLNIAIK